MISIELILHQVIENLKEIIEKSDDLLIEGGLSELNIVLKKVIDESMANIVGEILSNLDEELRQNEQRKRDYEIVNRVADSVKVPIVALGGAGKIEDLENCYKITKVNGLAAGSLFVYQGDRKAVLINYPEKKLIRKKFNSN